MISDEELLARIDAACENYRGQGDDLCEAAGLMIVGRLYGWRVARLVMPVRIWKLATKEFGDPKELLPERGRLAHRSLGLKIADKAGAYWEFIRGHLTMELHDRKNFTELT